MTHQGHGHLTLQQEHGGVSGGVAALAGRMMEITGSRPARTNNGIHGIHGRHLLGRHQDMMRVVGVPPGTCDLHPCLSKQSTLCAQLWIRLHVVLLRLLQDFVVRCFVNFAIWFCSNCSPFSQ